MAPLSDAGLLLQAYYEALYERLTERKDSLTRRVTEILTQELAGRDFSTEKRDAYLEACLAFVEERLEIYNPIGLHYTFDRVRSQEAIALEQQLDWYDSREEFFSLREAARAKAEEGMADARMHELAAELIRERGAFPDRSIIAAYRGEPALNKVPDYVVSLAIEEEIVRRGE
jgi:hypothetical protein